MKKQGNIVIEKDGIKVGDRVRCHDCYNLKDYYGYIAVIDPDNSVQNSYLLRLEGFNGVDEYYISKYVYRFWYEDWYPESEKKDAVNCRWGSKEDFEIIDNRYDLSVRYDQLKMNVAQNDISTEEKLNIIWNSYGINTTNKQTTMQKLTSTMKRMLSKSLQEQFKAGLRNGNLELTETGKNELLEILAVEKEKELTEIAKDIIKEEKE